MMSMTRDTKKPARMTSSHTSSDSGDRNEKKLTDFSGVFTYSRLIPEF